MRQVRQSLVKHGVRKEEQGNERIVNGKAEHRKVCGGHGLGGAGLWMERRR